MVVKINFTMDYADPTNSLLLSFMQRAVEATNYPARVQKPYTMEDQHEIK